MEFRVALTFDAEHPDRPASPGVQDRLLDVLDRRAVPATFFIQGRWAEAFPATARRIAEAGHLVGSHSHYHVRMPLLSDDGLAADLADARLAILETTGVDPRPWFRLPFGAGGNDARVLGAVAAAGYRHVGWDVEADDWDPRRSDAIVEDALVDGAIERGDGAVVLLHTWPDAAERALPGIVARLRDAGAALVRLDEPGMPGTA